MMNEVNKFYEDVMKDFIERLNKKYQNRDGLDSNHIEILQTKLNEKLKNPHLLFQKAILDYNQDQPQVNQPIPDYKPQNPVLKSQVYDSDDDSQSDDLLKFKDLNNHQNIDVKLENLQNQEQIKQNPKQAKEQFQDNQDSASQHLKQQKMNKAYNEVTLHIIGTYSTKSKKHRARDQTTKIQLENVFAKVYSIGNFRSQVCYHKLTCQFTKSQGDQIKL